MHQNKIWFWLLLDMLNTRKKKHKRSLGKQIIIFSAIFLMTLPWLAYRYMDEMKDFLIQGQSDAQLLTAKAIATFLHNRSDLFGLSNNAGELFNEDNSLYAYPLKLKLTVDGYDDDWKETLPAGSYFNNKSPIYSAVRNADNSTKTTGLSYQLLLGEYEKYLYGLLRVTDKMVIYRHPAYARLDNSDQVRIELMDNNGNLRRYLLLTEAPGNISVYEMQKDWKNPLSGQPEQALTGIWKDTAKGYDLEFRLPKKWFDKNQNLAISVVDINNDKDRQIEGIIRTTKQQSSDTLNTLIIRSSELDRVLQGIGYADANICIVDRYRRVRALLGLNTSQNHSCSSGGKISSTLVEKSLMGKSSLQQKLINDKENIIIASQPIYQNEKIIGVVLVEKNSQKILSKQRTSLNQIIFATAIVFIVALSGLLLFSSLLAYRIRRLQRETSSAIDQDGRLVNTVTLTDRHSNDEIGELSRGFSHLLSQLKRYTGFLESVPRTLRHEILNPLNTISMTLQKMSSANTFDEKLIISANKAIRQLELIVHSLTEAAHIEDALSNDDKANFDIAELLSEYVSNIKLKHTNSRFTYDGPDCGIHIYGNDSRITQLLDKLKDNAIDFAKNGSIIKFELSLAPNNHQQNHILISVCNSGPLIDEAILKSLCNNIMSHRQGASHTPHLGIGLYVASRIASYHDAQLIIKNQETKDGVCVLMNFPVII